MHGPHEDAAEGNPEEGDRAEACAEHRTEDGARTGDVEQLDEECAPAGQRHVVHPVVEAPARHLGRHIGACLPLQIAPVGEVGGHQQGQTYQKSNHIPVRFDAKIRRIVKFFAKLLHEINFFQIFAVPKRTQRHQAKVWAGRISSVVEHFTRNEGVPSSNLGFGSQNQEVTI